MNQQNQEPLDSEWSPVAVALRGLLEAGWLPEVVAERLGTMIDVIVEDLKRTNGRTRSKNGYTHGRTANHG